MTMQLVLTATSVYFYIFPMNRFVTSKKARVNEGHTWSTSRSAPLESKNGAVPVPVNNDKRVIPESQAEHDASKDCNNVAHINNTKIVCLHFFIFNNRNSVLIFIF